MTVRVNRIEGALAGLATGDALGAGYEFGPPVTEPVEMIGGGPFGWEPGEWIDDTQMAICIAENSSPGTIVLTDVGVRFITWAGECEDIRSQTRAVLSQVTTGDELLQVSLDHYRVNPRHSAGNGSLMRTEPVALLGATYGVSAIPEDWTSILHGWPGHTADNLAMLAVQAAGDSR